MLNESEAATTSSAPVKYNLGSRSSVEHDNNNDVLPGESLYQHPPLTHCVLPPAGGDHSSNISGGSSPRQVCPLHHDP